MGKLLESLAVLCASIGLAAAAFAVGWTAWVTLPVVWSFLPMQAKLFLGGLGLIVLAGICAQVNGRG